MLMSYDFPGNLKGLENITEDATVGCKNGMIGIQNLPNHFTNPEEDRVKRALERKLFSPIPSRNRPFAQSWSYNSLETTWISALGVQPSFSQKAFPSLFV
jgi:DNA-binding NtrC family response regulator